MREVKKTQHTIRPGVFVVTGASKDQFIKKVWNIAESIKHKWYLDNEIEVYSWLNIIGVNRYIKVPKLLSYKKNLYSSEIIIEKVDGTNLKKVNSIKKSKVYIEIIDKLILLNKGNYRKWNFARSKTISNIYLRSLAVCFIAMIKNVGLSIRLSNIFFTKIKFHQFLKLRRPLFFTHNDISDTNIVLGKKGYTLIDFGIADFSDKIVDIAVIIYYHLDENKFISTFIKSHIIQKYLNTIDRKIVKSYLYYLLVYDYATGIRKSEKDLMGYTKKIDKLNI